MELSYTTKKVASLCTEPKEALKQLGKDCATKLQLRIAQLSDAKNLGKLQPPLARCHPLVGDRKGQYAMDLKHPKRLVFEPNWEKLQIKKGEPIDLESITAIVIIEIVDYH